MSSARFDPLPSGFLWEMIVSIKSYSISLGVLASATTLSRAYICLTSSQIHAKKNYLPCLKFPRSFIVLGASEEEGASRKWKALATNKPSEEHVVESQWLSLRHPWVSPSSTPADATSCCCLWLNLWSRQPAPLWKGWERGWEEGGELSREGREGPYLLSQVFTPWL